MNVHDQVANRLLRAAHQDQLEQDMRQYSKLLREAIGSLVAKEDTIQTLEPGMPFDSAVIGVCVDGGAMRVVYDFHAAISMYQQVMKVELMDEAIKGFDQLLKGMHEAWKQRGGPMNLPLFVTPASQIIDMYEAAKQMMPSKDSSGGP